MACFNEAAAAAAENGLAEQALRHDDRGFNEAAAAAAENGRSAPSPPRRTRRRFNEAAAAAAENGRNNSHARRAEVALQ